MASLNKALLKELSLLPDCPKIMVIGEPDTGKSTIITMLARWFRSRSQNIAIVDSDMGQSDIGPPGFVSYGIAEQEITSLQSIVSDGSYPVGKTSPFGKELSLVTGTRICVRAAQHRNPDAILIDTCGLVGSPKGVQLKCAKAETIKPDLILALHTPALVPLIDCLKSLGFHVRNFLPSKKAKTKSDEERKKNRISGWNRYIGNKPSLLNIPHSHGAVHRWWDENKYIDINQIPHGTVAAIHNPEAPKLQIPCIWYALKGKPYILAPLPEDYELNTVWVTTYKLKLNRNTVVSA